MKRLILLVCAVSTFIVAQDDVTLAGQYKLTGVNVEYTYIARHDIDLTVSDPYGFGITQTLQTIPQGVPFNNQTMQLTEAGLGAIGINLNLTLNEDGTGSIAEGSFYPDINTITDENGLCVTVQQVLPVTDDFLYTSNDALGLGFQGYNVVGLPSGIRPTDENGQPIGTSGLGGFGLSGSNTFEDFPLMPANPTLCGPDGNCFPFTTGDADGSETLEIYPDVNLLGFSEYVPGGAPLTGYSGGLFHKSGMNGGAMGDLTSFFPGNTTPDVYLEWHGIDGASSGLGCGGEDNCLGETTDEDGDGTWFDRELGIPAVPATFVEGLDYPIYGDVSSIFGGTVDVATSGFLMDPSGSLATWGNFLTAQGGLYQMCAGYLAEGTPGITEEICAMFLTDDSAGTMDPSCMDDYTPGNFMALADCSGKLVMNFNVPCAPVLEAREVLVEFIEVGGGECGTGDVTLDGQVNVLDVVSLVQTVLSGAEGDCAGDITLDGQLNVLDVVALVQQVLSGGRVDGATSAKFNVNGNEVTMTANGYVAAVEMTLSHGNDFAIELTDNAFVAEYITTANTTRLMIVEPGDSHLFNATGDFTIEDYIAASNSESYMSTSVNMLKDYSINAAYPNPFNPSTQMSITLNTTADVSVKVFNMNGQLIDVIANGQMSSGSYNFTWDGTNAPSGVYFIQTEVNSDINNQKIMLIK